MSSGRAGQSAGWRLGLGLGLGSSPQPADWGARNPESRHTGAKAQRVPCPCPAHPLITGHPPPALWAKKQKTGPAGAFDLLVACCDPLLRTTRATTYYAGGRVTEGEARREAGGGGRGGGGRSVVGRSVGRGRGGRATGARECSACDAGVGEGEWVHLKNHLPVLRAACCFDCSD
jgi:hypothetical protein